jgi:hypothetical protein
VIAGFHGAQCSWPAATEWGRLGSSNEPTVSCFSVDVADPLRVARSFPSRASRQITRGTRTINLMGAPFEEQR